MRQPPHVYRQRRQLVAASVLTVVLLPVAAFTGHHRAPIRQAATPDVAPVRHTVPVVATGYLAPGSDPRALPGPILIADKANNRVLIVDPSGRVEWIRPGLAIPDDAFFTPDGRRLIVTQEDDFAITELDRATGRVVWRYGHPGVPGDAVGYVHNPDDAMRLTDGTVVAADIKNCRLLEISGAAPTTQLGQLGACIHDPPTAYGSPNGMFPLRDGHFLVTEINGDWVDEVDRAGHVYWSTNPPGVAYPSDSNQIGPDRYLTVDYSDPGQVVVFDHTGTLLWRFAEGLNHPSLAMGLPNGDILLNDDYNDRVIVIDPRSNRIVWQYGHTGVPGSAPGYLNVPDGLDPLPPNSYADRYE